jgi:hypothetical protein
VTGGVSVGSLMSARGHHAAKLLAERLDRRLAQLADRDAEEDPEAEEL